MAARRVLPVVCLYLLHSVFSLSDYQATAQSNTMSDQPQHDQNWPISRQTRSAAVAAPESQPEDQRTAWNDSDSYSFAIPSEAEVTTVHLKLRVDFDKKVLSGSVDLIVERRDPAATRLVLDTRDLDITTVTELTSGAPLSWRWGEPDRALGRPLHVELPAGDSAQVSIAYSTSPNSTALAWLTPEQTAGKRQPFVFSHSSRIYCRSIVPLQDTPAVKQTYTAELTVPAGLTALMSALREGNETAGGESMFRFRQPVPMPSYLFALAVGDLESRPLGSRSAVWAEPELVDRAAYEFAETEQMLQMVEEMLGPYIWGVYDILVMPPNYLYGGMENPCLTFVTPTLLAGDRSLIDLVAHEITHSWIGNLVTNRNWEHVWLNEGVTKFIERKIIGRLRGDPARHLSASSGWKILKDAVRTRGATSPLTRLVLQLEGTNPQEAFSITPYEKGHTLLWYLEQLVGGAEQFEAFLKAYVVKFQFQVIDSEDFRSFLLEFFSEKANEDVFAQVDWEAWFTSPGMPPYEPIFDTSLIEACSQLRQRWTDWDVRKPAPFSATDLDTLSSNQIIELLSQLLEEKPLTLTKLKKMEELYGMNARGNAEIRYRWLRLCIVGRWLEQVPLALEMVTTQGRMKFVRALYRELYAWEEVRNRTIETYQNNKQYMMFLARYTVGKALNLIE